MSTEALDPIPPQPIPSDLEKRVSAAEKEVDASRRAQEEAQRAYEGHHLTRLQKEQNELRANIGKANQRAKDAQKSLADSVAALNKSLESKKE